MLLRSGILHYKAMRSETTFKQIPIVHKTASAIDLAWTRTVFRIGFITVLILIPVTGLFRIDVSSGFIILDHQVWFSDFFIVFGFWLSAACLLIMLYSSMGNVFCGWLCPQNTVSTWANKITSKLLGKSALLNWGDEPKTERISAGKNKARNWITLGLKILFMSLFFAMIPMLYFFPPGAIWSFITFQDDQRLAGSLYWIYTVFTFIAFANIAVVRHYVCRYMCIYRMWQYLFKTRDTLHIEYDSTRSDDCATCSYCEIVCPVDIDPRNTLTYDSCINCGECITACNNIHKREGVKGLLGFKFGPRKGKQLSNNTMRLSSLLRRASWVAPVFLLALTLFAWGIFSYDSYHLSVYRADMLNAQQVYDYRINVSNKSYRPASVAIHVEGLPEGSYTLDNRQLSFQTADRKDLNLHIDENLPNGLYTIVVRANSDDGWQESFSIQHFTHKS